MKKKHEPETVQIGSELDFEIAGYLDREASEFYVFYADGKPMDFIGTPPVKPTARVYVENQIRSLNNPADTSSRASFLAECKQRICALLDIDPSIPESEFNPVFSYKIHRVVAGYSQYLHAAVQLLTDHAPLIKSYMLSTDTLTGPMVKIIGSDGIYYIQKGAEIPVLITRAMIALLKAESKRTKQA